MFCYCIVWFFVVVIFLWYMSIFFGCSYVFWCFWMLCGCGCSLVCGVCWCCYGLCGICSFGYLSGRCGGIEVMFMYECRGMGEVENWVKCVVGVIMWC